MKNQGMQNSQELMVYQSMCPKNTNPYCLKTNHYSNQSAENFVG